MDILYRGEVKYHCLVLISVVLSFTITCSVVLIGADVSQHSYLGGGGGIGE